LKSIIFDNIWWKIIIFRVINRLSYFLHYFHNKFRLNTILIKIIFTEKWRISIKIPTYVLIIKRTEDNLRENHYDIIGCSVLNETFFLYGFQSIIIIIDSVSASMQMYMKFAWINAICTLFWVEYVPCIW